MTNIDVQKYRVTYTLRGNIRECKYFATIDEAIMEYIKQITPREDGWSKTRLLDTRISEWSEKEQKYIKLR